MKKQLVLLLLPLTLLTGCDNVRHALFPGSHDNRADASTVCRATPVYLTVPISSDNQVVADGYTNGDDGTRLTVALTKTDTRCQVGHSASDVNQWGLCGDASTYQTFNDTGIAPDGTSVAFAPANITVNGAHSRGYVLIAIRIDQSCH